MESRELRNAFGTFATGVTVVTCTNDEGEPHGATVNAFTAVSLDPPLAQVTVGRTSRACAFLADKPFTINVLADDQLDVAWHFAGRPAAHPPTWVDGPTAPLLQGAATTISCRPWRTYDGGDHLIVVGEVEQADVTDRDPLLFHGGQFRYLSPDHDAAPGVHWGGSIDCPDSGWFDATAAFQPLQRTSA